MPRYDQQRMTPLDRFFQRYLHPADALGEILFGLIMALGFTGAVSLGIEHPTTRELLHAILGCTAAWAIVDGMSFALVAVFERGWRRRLARDVLAQTDHERQLEAVGERVDQRLGLDRLTSPEERRRIHQAVLEILKRGHWRPPHVRRHDVLGGLAITLVILLAVVPVLLPYLFVFDPQWAVRVSSLIALGMLFLLGAWWGRTVGSNPVVVGTLMLVVGAAMVLITIVLGR